MSLSPFIWLDICVDLHIMNQPCISCIKPIWHYMQKCVISHIHMLLVITNSYPVILKAHLILGNYALYKKSSQFFRASERSWTLEESATFTFLDHIIPFYIINVVILYAKIIVATTAKQRIFLQQMKFITINTTEHDEEINTWPGAQPPKIYLI